MGLWGDEEEAKGEEKEENVVSFSLILFYKFSAQPVQGRARVSDSSKRLVRQLTNVMIFVAPSVWSALV